MYTGKIMGHSGHPRDVGKIENPSGMGTMGNLKYSDIVRIYLGIDGNQIIRDVEFKIFDYGATMTTSSMTTELAKGKTVQEVTTATNKVVMEAPDELPPVKVRCSLLAEKTIHAALWGYA